MRGTWADRGVAAVLLLALLAMAGVAGMFSAGMEPLEPLAADPAPVSTPGGAGLVDLNTADREELMSLPGIGEVRAQAILDWREEHGPFRYVEHLIQVPGIGEGILAGLMEYVSVGGNEYAEDPGG